MRLDRGLRIAQMKPYPLGHGALSTEGFNEEEPRCTIGGVKDPGLWLGDHQLPTHIELQVRLIPVWVDNQAASAQLSENSPCPLYPPHSAISHILIRNIGMGQYQKSSGDEKIPFNGTSFLDYTLELPKPYLYQKNFLVQPEGRDIRWTPQGRLFLWAYGATQIEDDIHPLVMTLESLRDETYVRSSSLLTWRNRGISPIGEVQRSDEVIFQDIFEEDQTRTLTESIESGMAHFNLLVGVDEKGSPVKIPYHSYRFSKDFLYYKKGE